MLARLEERSPGITGYHPPAVTEGGTAPATPTNQASPRAPGAGADLAAAISAEWEGGGTSPRPQGPGAAAAGAAAQQREGGGEGAAASPAERSAAAASPPAAEPGQQPAGGGESAAAEAAAAAREGPGKEDGEEGELLALPRARGEPDPLCPLNVVDCIVCMTRPVQVSWARHSITRVWNHQGCPPCLGAAAHCGRHSAAPPVALCKCAPRIMERSQDDVRQLGQHCRGHLLMLKGAAGDSRRVPWALLGMWLPPLQC